MSTPNAKALESPPALTPIGASAAVVSFARLAQELAAAQDAVRQSAIDAGGDRPRGLAQRFAAGWIAAEGGSWASTPRARQSFKETMTEQAHAGSAAYVIGFPGNAYTDFLRERFGRYDAPGYEVVLGPAWKPLKDSASQAARPVRKVRFLDEVRSWIQGVRDLWRSFRGQHPAYQVGEILIWLACSAALIVLTHDPARALTGRIVACLILGLPFATVAVVALLAVVGALRVVVDLFRPATARQTTKDLAWFVVTAVALTAGVEVIVLSIWAVSSAVAWLNGTEGPSALELARKAAGIGVTLSAFLAGVVLVVAGADSLNAIVNRIWPRSTSATAGGTP